MKMDLILHPGHGKCGSSSVQKFLFDNRAALQDAGVAVPDRFLHFRFEKNCDFSVQQPAVSYLSKLANQGKSSLLERRLEEAIEKAEQSDIHTFVISAENLSSRPTRSLHDIFSKYFNVKKVLYYIRRQDEYLLSAWQQWGHKSGKKFAEYCQVQLRIGHPTYTANARMLESHYGKGILEVAPFARNAFHNQDLISDFLVRTGLDNLSNLKSTSSIENVSLSPLVCDYLAQFPGIYTSAHDNYPKVSLEKFKSSEPWLFEPGKDYLSTSMRRSILNHFDVLNRDLHAAYFPDISFDLLFGLSASDPKDRQEHLPKSLEKQQLEFLDHWVKKWVGSKKIRSFLTSKASMIQNVRKHLARSK
jgi:hypothetical protein